MSGRAWKWEETNSKRGRQREKKKEGKKKGRKERYFSLRANVKLGVGKRLEHRKSKIKTVYLQHTKQGGKWHQTQSVGQ